jgi:ribonuclease HI
MSVPAPHFLLYAEAVPLAAPPDLQPGPLAGASGLCGAGRWRFVLRQPGGETSLEATDEEPEAGSERLELLAVIRGLEALEAPSRVTLLSGSRQIRRGLEFGLSQWRENDWQWERYGRMTPMKNGDLWQRLDRLLEIHRIECRPTRLSKVDDLSSPPRVPRQAPARRDRRGRTVRVDVPHKAAAKSEIRSTKSRTKSKFKRRNVRSGHGFGHLSFVLPGLFRMSNFVLRASQGVLRAWRLGFAGRFG